METLLYNMVKKDDLRELLELFEGCIHLPIQLLDENGEILQSQGETQNFCCKLNQCFPKDSGCGILHNNAAKQALSLGEAYIFSCPANLNHIVFPLEIKNIYAGCVLVGPFLLEDADSSFLLDLEKKFRLDTRILFELSDDLQEVPVISPKEATCISRLLYRLFENLLIDSKEQFQINQGKMHQQSKISESIQMYKNIPLNIGNSYPYEKEKDLITKVKTGNVREAKGILNDLLGYVFFSEGNSLPTLTARATELCSLLSRAAIEGGASTDTILRINNQFLQTIQQITSLDDLCYKLQEIVEVFTESMFNPVSSKSNDAIKSAIRYISANYALDINLQDVASQVHLNPSYFSSLFKQSTGSSFKEYLNMVRIEESKRLLSNTDYSIIDIAIAVGFEDQSYFSKVFKKYTGLTPKQYR